MYTLYDRASLAYQKSRKLEVFDRKLGGTHTIIPLSMW